MDNGRRRRPWRTAAGAVAGMATVMIAAGLALASAYARPQGAPLPTVDSRPGTCHLAEDPLELIATVSDTAPPVPCSTPHQTETAWQTQLSGPLSLQTSRPNPELLVSQFAPSCDDYLRIRAYLGARPQDTYWGISTWAKFPTRHEWARGVRTMACDLSVDPNRAGGPTVAFALARYLRRPDSSALRLCRLGEALVTCDQPHVAEATSPNVTFPPGPWPGEAAARSMTLAACMSVVDAYLNSELSSRPNLEIEPVGPNETQWNKGIRSADCWIAQRDGTPVTGTVRGGFG